MMSGNSLCRAWTRAMAVVGGLWNGERVVVALFVARIVSAATGPLYSASATLFLLSAFAFLVEIATESSASALIHFQTRRGASSGILLGAVTLPGVMLSRLIQFYRMHADNGNYFSELAHLRMQYWAALACCFSVLIFFLFLLQCSPENTKSLLLGRVMISKYSTFCATLSIAACSLSIAWKLIAVPPALGILLHLFCHGATTVALIQHLLCIFPYCASFGEALLVSNGLVLYFGDIFVRTILKMNICTSWSKQYLIITGTPSEISIVIQGLLLGLVILPIAYGGSCRIWNYLLVSKRGGNQRVQEGTILVSSVIFYILLLTMLTLLAPTWMRFVQDFGMHPLLWVLQFVFKDPFQRIALCTYWICVICVSVFQFYDISKHSKMERILLRKYYHLVAVLMFVPALVLQPAFLDLAFGAALGVFIVLEMIRIWNIWPLGKFVHHFMHAFTDHRDSELLIVSHFSLLLGCALPKWMSSGMYSRPLAPFAGILSLGIGDTMASMVGYKYGVLRWSKSGKKTMEGTAAGISSVLAACSILVPVLASSGYVLSQNWLSLIYAVALTGLLEAYTAQLDNAFIPLVFYSLLCL